MWTSVVIFLLAAAPVAVLGTIPVSFDYGVSSGDPLPNQVIIWTRVTIRSALPPNPEEMVSGNWRVSLTRDMKQIASEGDFETDGDVDWTVKIDAGGLEPATTYYYQFESQGILSPIGRTKTSAGASTPIDRLRYATFSCSTYGYAYFHAFDFASRYDDLDFALHLGDFLYEYNRGMISPDRYGRQGYRHIPYTEPLPSSDRVTGHFDTPEMAGELFSFDDYVTRYKAYRADPATQALSAAVPWIVVWDDHEVADNSHVNGSRNHDDCNIYAATPCDPPVNETDIATWEERKANGILAFHLYMPIRSQDASGEFIGPKIYRQFQYGDLASLIMLENRLVARTNSNPTPDNPIEDFSDGYESIQRQVMEIIGNSTIESWPGSEVETQLLEFRDRMEEYARSEDHYMIGPEQEEWLNNTVQDAVNSGTKWVLLGQQQVMANAYLFDFEKAIDNAPTEVERAMWSEVYYNVTSGEPGATTCNYATNPAYQRVDYRKCYNVTESQRDLYRFFAAAGKYKIPWIFDDWAGYKAEKARVLDILSAMNGNVVVNTGDVHQEIASVLETDDGSKIVGTEFSISTTANWLEGSVITTPMAFNDAAFVASNEDTMRYFSTNGRGVAIFTLTHEKMHMDYFYPSEPSKLTYEGVCDAGFDYYHSAVLEDYGISPNVNDMIRVTCLPGPGKQPYSYMIENFGIHMSNPYLVDVAF